MTNILVQHIILEESTSIHWVNAKKAAKINIVEFANSVDLDKAAHYMSTAPYESTLFALCLNS